MAAFRLPYNHELLTMVVLHQVQALAKTHGRKPLLLHQAQRLPRNKGPQRGLILVPQAVPVQALQVIGMTSHRVLLHHQCLNRAVALSFQACGRTL